MNQEVALHYFGGNDVVENGFSRLGVNLIEAQIGPALLEFVSLSGFGELILNRHRRLIT